MVKIHGREYVTVAERVAAAHGQGLQSVTSELLHYGEQIVVKATVTLADGRTFTGHAEERRGSEGIAGESPLEVAETSAVGRALGYAGFGLATGSVASADEVLRKEKPAEKPGEKPTEKKPNGNGQATITAFWKAVRAREMTVEEGKALVAQHGGDFAAALASLTA
jgi:hypothetical protein